MVHGVGRGRIADAGPVSMAEREILVHNTKCGLMSYIRLGFAPDARLKPAS